MSGVVVRAKLIDAVSGAATITSAAVPVGYDRRLTLDLAWTGTLTGTFSLESSHDGTPTTFRTVPGAAAEFTTSPNAQPAGSASSMIANFQNVPGTHWRLVYTFGSGAGTVTAHLAQGDILVH